MENTDAGDFLGHIERTAEAILKGKNKMINDNKDLKAHNFKIIYHKNCMDGLASAFIAKTTLEKTGEVQCIALQYGEEQVLFGRDEMIGLTHPITKDDIVYFVDFSLKRDLMIELSSMVKEIVVLDHHKTAEENLRGLEDELKNVTVIFDMNKSGATLCYDYFADGGLENGLVFEYIADRDLWNWKLYRTKEINEYIRFSVKPNVLESFSEMYTFFDPVLFAQNGYVLLKQQEIQVASKVKKVKDTIINGIDFKMLNATENISEIGNEICKIYNTPALIYFFTENDEVVCSLRSIDTLQDVSVVAKALGGGGHRNACGFTLSVDEFYKFMYKSKTSFAPYVDECNVEDKSFESIAKDVIKYLNANHHPHTRIIIDSSSCEIVEGLKCFHTTEYIKD